MNGGGNDPVNPVLELFEFLGRKGLSLDGVVDVDGDGGWVEHPAAFAVERKGASNAHGDDGVAEIAHHPENSLAERLYPPVQGTAPFGKDRKAGSVVEGFFGEPV